MRNRGTPSATYWTYDPRTGHREDLGIRVTLASPDFTRDGQSVIGCSDRGIYGFTLRERRLEKVADLGSILPTSPVFGWPWAGLDPQDAPIVQSFTGSHELCTLELEQP